MLNDGLDLGTTQTELGIVLYSQPKDSPFIKELYIPLIEKGHLSTEYADAVYYPEPVRLMPKGAPSIRVKLYLEQDGGKTVFTADQTLGEILGEGTACAGNYLFGMKISQDGKAVLCLKGEDQREYVSVLACLNVPIRKNERE